MQANQGETAKDAAFGRFTSEASIRFQIVILLQCGLTAFENSERQRNFLARAPQAVALLLDNGASLRLQANQGETAKDAAFEEGYMDLAE